MCMMFQKLILSRVFIDWYEAYQIAEFQWQEYPVLDDTDSDQNIIARRRQSVSLCVPEESTHIMSLWYQSETVMWVVKLSLSEFVSKFDEQESQ